MIILDKALEERERTGAPVQLAVIGAGYIARGILAHILDAARDQARGRLQSTPRRRSRASRHDGRRTRCRGFRRVARACCRGRKDRAHAGSGGCLRGRLDRRGHRDNRRDRLRSDDLSQRDRARQARRPRERRARRYSRPYPGSVCPTAGVLTNTDGDEPGVVLNLLRYVRSIGLEPLLAGNIKGFLDHSRTPETQREFAETVGQRAHMVTSFADGTNSRWKQRWLRTRQASRSSAVA